MKTKQFAMTVLTATLLVTVFGSVSVFAPNPSPQNPVFPLDVVITNQDPIQVTIEGTAEAIDVSVDGTVSIDDTDPLDVEVPNGVEITNPEDITLDVTGWLHTTQKGHVYYDTFDQGANYGVVSVDTEGYREITVLLEATQDSVMFTISWEVDGVLRDAERFTYGNEKPASPLTAIFKTYPVQGEYMRIEYYAAPGVLSSGESVAVAYYVTT